MPSFCPQAKLYAVSEQTIAVSKPPLLTLLTNGGNASVPNWNVPSGAYKPGETLVDVLTCSTVTADKNGGVLVAGHAGNPQVSSRSIIPSHHGRERVLSFSYTKG